MVKLKTTELFRAVLIILFIILGLIKWADWGLLGIGGGVMVVPELYFLLKEFGFYQSHVIQAAACTALACGFVTSGNSTFFQILKEGCFSFPF